MERIDHPSHVISDDVVNIINSYNEAQTAAQERQERMAMLSRPNEEERRAIAEVMEAASSGGLTTDMRERLREVRAGIFERVQDTVLHQEVDLISPLKWLPLEPDPPEPAWIDSTFWWARTEWWAAEHMTVRDDSDGLHFFGGVTTHDGDLHKNSFGAVAYFELQKERIPRSAANRFLSTPHVELFGGLLGYTGDDDIFTGDLWSKCWMHRDQQIFQIGFGMNGPAPIILGQAHEVETLIFEENNERSVHVDLRGFQWMPPVTFGGVIPTASLWARIEVKFDIQTEGAGTLLWADPQVLLRTFQWPLTAL